jgi:hypothetical protein
MLGPLAFALLLPGVLGTASLAPPDPIGCDLSGYSAAPGLTAAVSANVLTLAWAGAGEDQVRLVLTIRSGVPTFEEIAVRTGAGGWVAVARGLTPEYEVVSGLRRISEQQLQPLRQLGVELTSEVVDKYKWDVFWDDPLFLGPAPGAGLQASGPPRDGVAHQPGLPRSPSEIRRAKAVFRATRCAVKTDGARLQATYPGTTLGVFSGGFQVTAYRGSNLIKTEVFGSTTEPSVAYKYDAGLSGLSTSHARVAWRDLAGHWQDYRFGGAPNQARVALKAANHVVVAETGTGSIAAFPPPHTFFWAREVPTNLGYDWYRKDGPSSFSFGIRQAEGEDDPRYVGNFALYSAPPGTVQRMPAFFYLHPRSATEAHEAVLAFTHGDRFKALPGFQVMAHHFHGSSARRILDSGTPDSRIADFDAVKGAGINIFSTADSPQPLNVQAASFEAARRSWDRDFAYMPSVEIFSNLAGGHTDVLLAKPVYWVEGREAGTPLVQNDSRYGQVYRPATAGELMEMVTRENGLVFMPHPRTKGSTGYPDAIRDRPHFNHERYAGVGWRWGMGLDLSEKRMSEDRVLPLIDEMNNWAADKAGPAKTMIAINETYDQHPGDDVYAMGPVNYVKVAHVPAVAGDFGPILDALRTGNFFMTSGEVLIPAYEVATRGAKRVVVADVEWTFPLDFVEAVWGDGTRTDSRVVSATDLPPFGKKHFEIDVPATAKWVRFAAWDAAGNGALAQPVRVR